MTDKYDCSKLLIDFTVVPPGTRIVDHYPELKMYPAFTQQQNENVIKLSILTADQKSPFWKLRGDRELMMKAIFAFLEIGTMNLIGKELFDKVLQYQHEGVIDCWLAYLKHQYAIDFNEWIISKETYDMLLEETKRERNKDEDAMKYADSKIKIRNHLRNIGNDLKEIEPRIFEDARMIQPVAQAVTREKIKNYAEKHAYISEDIL